jgi:hypothetical protein
LPIGQYEDFAACVAANRDKEDPEAYCAAIENSQRGAGKVTEALEALKALQAKDPKGQRFYVTAQVKQIDEEGFEADIVASTANIDRDREVVNPHGMVVPKPRRVPLVSSHQYGDLRKQIGDVPSVKLNGEITARPRWFVGMGNDEADWAFALVKMGVAAFSIGFLPLEWTDADLADEKTVEEIVAGKKPLREYTKWELAEISQVIVPSNRGAVQRMVEAGILPKDYKTEGLKDGPMDENAQKAFDAALKLWQERQAKNVTVSVIVNEGPGDGKVPAAPVPEKQPEHPAAQIAGEQMNARAECPEGQEWDAAEGKCVDKKAAPVVEPVVDPAKSFDLLSLFEAAGKKEIDVPKVEIKVPTPKAAAVVEITFEKDILPKLKDALDEFADTLRVEVANAVNQSLKESEAKVSGAVEVAIAAKFGPDSAAHTKTTDLIKAVMSGVKEFVKTEIALAKGNVDAWLQ